MGICNSNNNHSSMNGDKQNSYIFSNKGNIDMNKKKPSNKISPQFQNKKYDWDMNAPKIEKFRQPRPAKAEAGYFNADFNMNDQSGKQLSKMGSNLWVNFNYSKDNFDMNAKVRLRFI